MRLRLWLFVLAFTVAIAAAVSTGGFGPVKAQGPLTLSADIQQRLIALKPLRGPGIDREVFNGKPILVTYFASW